MSKLSERNVCTKIISPAIEAAGWNRESQYREEVNLTSGRVVVRGNKVKRDLLALVTRSSHGTCKLESEKLFGFQFGLPPLTEQARIVTRVGELRRLCTDLRSRLTRQQDIQRALSAALVEQVAA